MTVDCITIAIEASGYEYCVGEAFLRHLVHPLGKFLKTFQQMPLSFLHLEMTPLQWAMSDINAIQRG